MPTREEIVSTYCCFLEVFGGMRSVCIVPPALKPERQGSSLYQVAGEFYTVFRQMYPSSEVSSMRPEAESAVPKDQHLMVVGDVADCLFVERLLDELPSRRFISGWSGIFDSSIEHVYQPIPGQFDYGVVMSVMAPWGKRVICCWGTSALGCYGACRIILSQRLIERLYVFFHNIGQSFELLVKVPGNTFLCESTRVIAGDWEGAFCDEHLRDFNLEVTSPLDLNDLPMMPTLHDFICTDTACLLAPGKQFSPFAGSRL